MEKDTVYIICFILTAGISPLASIWLLTNEYKTRVKGSKALSEFSDLTVPAEILNWINQFRFSTEIRIADDAYAIPQAVFWAKHPNYVVISKFILGQANDKIPQFENKHLLALIAHELGHIESESHSTWIQIALMSGFFISLYLLLLNLFLFNLTYFLFSLFLAVAFLFAVNLFSQINEYRADAFAVNFARIPLDDFSFALTALQNYYDHRNIASKKTLQRIKRNLRNLIINTHPSIERRIQRLQNFSDNPL